MESAPAYGIASFFAQTDAVARCALLVLVGMSVATWYLILVKSIHAFVERRHIARFLQEFWGAPSLDEATSNLDARPLVDPFSSLALHAIRAVSHHAEHGANRLDQAGSAHEFLTRAMRNAIAEHSLRAESGMTVLASIGATAPFVGLFGTVWGVYKALVNIGMTGQGTLDKVAGPVGEALIMTAIGLAVAIPAVLAYNAFVRRNRLVSARLDAFAHDLFALLTTGAPIKTAER